MCVGHVLPVGRQSADNFRMCGGRDSDLVALTQRDLLRQSVTSYKVDGDAFTADRPRVWSGRRFMLRPGLRSFDLHPDGGRFALAAAAENDSAVRQDKLVFTFNFDEELKRLVPTP